MILIILLTIGGIVLVWLAFVFGMVRPCQRVITARDFTDFSGDVQSWLRSETE